MIVYQQATTGVLHRRRNCSIASRTRYSHFAVEFTPEREAQVERCGKCWDGFKPGEVAPVLRTTTVANSTTGTFPNLPRNWTDAERVEYARVKIAEAIVRLIAEGRTYDVATAVAFAEVSRKWPSLLAKMIEAESARVGA